MEEEKEMNYEFEQMIDLDPKSENLIYVPKLRVGWIKFSFLVYFSVCGGSFGSEEML